MSDRLDMLHEWLHDDLNIGTYVLSPASEDASFRRYFRVKADGRSRIVMDAPPDKEDCHAFLDVTQRLVDGELNVPQVFAKDLEKGFLLLSDLGTDLYLHKLEERNADELYSDAIEALVQMQNRITLKGLPVYSEELLMQEMSLFSDWLVQRHCQISLDAAELEGMQALFRLLANSALKQPQVFVHRDFHSRNLMVCKNNPGIIDYQDALVGPLSYDLVSLLKDCYRKWPRAKIDEWTQLYLNRYAESAAVDVSAQEFKRYFDLMGVQRHLKASGIFARLNHRDGKADFLQDIPRTLSYIIDLQERYPELLGLVKLIREAVLPVLERK
jgi:aminoglycoside/choline kinase family phosphotransferase